MTRRLPDEAPIANERPARGGWACSSLFAYLLALALVGLDAATKLMTAAWLAFGESVPLIPGWLAFTHAHNRGAAFSLFHGQVPVLAIVSAVVTVGIIVYERKLGPRTTLHNLAISLLLGGAVGNLVDRVRLGYVIDMIDLQNGSGRNIWPVFNVADIALVVGVGFVLLATWGARGGEDKAAGSSPKAAAGKRRGKR